MVPNLPPSCSGRVDSLEEKWFKSRHPSLVRMTSPTFRIILVFMSKPKFHCSLERFGALGIIQKLAQGDRYEAVQYMLPLTMMFSRRALGAGIEERAISVEPDSCASYQDGALGLVALRLLQVKNRRLPQKQRIVKRNYLLCNVPESDHYNKM